MKLIKIIGHPLVTISLFLLILISGEHFGGIYLLYILMGLSIGALHAVLALIGIAIFVLAYQLVGKNASLKLALYILSIALMVFALVIFFVRSKGYNDESFNQAAPVISIGLFSLSAICCILNSIFHYYHQVRHKKMQRL